MAAQEGTHLPGGTHTYPGLQSRVRQVSGDLIGSHLAVISSHLVPSGHRTLAQVFLGTHLPGGTHTYPGLQSRVRQVRGDLIGSHLAGSTHLVPSAQRTLAQVIAGTHFLSRQTSGALQWIVSQVSSWANDDTASAKRVRRSFIMVRLIARVRLFEREWLVTVEASFIYVYAYGSEQVIYKATRHWSLPRRVGERAAYLHACVVFPCLVDFFRVCLIKHLFTPGIPTTL